MQQRTVAKKAEAVLEVLLALEVGSELVSVQSQSPNLSCLSEARGGVRIVVVVVVVVGADVVVLAGTGLTLNLVVVSGSTSSRFCDGGPPGRGMCLRSTQHLMDWEGQEMSSLTSSQSKEAKAWRHFPGQSLTSAVFVIVPNKPVRNCA